MSSQQDFGSEAITSRNDLVRLITPPPTEKARRIGMELETFVLDRNTLAPIDFSRFQLVLSRLQTEGWGSPDHEGIKLTGLKGIGPHTGSAVCGEPGCQIELAARPFENICESARYTDAFLSLLQKVAGQENCVVAIPGLYPLARGADIPLSERSRYQVFNDVCATIPNGAGYDLSRGTCGLQVNIDTTPDNWIESVRAAIGIQPVITALFANSSIYNRNVTNTVSQRAQLWFANWSAPLKDFNQLVFREDFSPRTLVDYLVDRQPCYFFYRNGGFVSAEGRTFGDLLDHPESRPPGFVGAPTISDFANVLGTVFSQVKIKPKGVLEFRGADGSYELRHALSALAVGLFYDADNLRAVHQLVTGWSQDERTIMEVAARTTGLNAPFTSNLSIRNVAQKLVEQAVSGLQRRGLGEESLLNPLLQIARGEAPTPAEAFRLAVVKDHLTPEEAFGRTVLGYTSPVIKAARPNALHAV